MPTYLYKCSSCGKESEVTHPMSECDDPSIETQIETSCNENTCDNPLENNALRGNKWNRVPHANLMYFGTGTSDKGGLKTLEEKSKYAKQRSRDYGNKQGVEELKKEHIKSIKKDFEGK